MLVLNCSIDTKTSKFSLFSAKTKLIKQKISKILMQFFVLYLKTHERPNCIR